MERIKSFKEFYPHYLKEHRSKANRNLHFIGTTGVLLLMIYAVRYNINYALGIPVFGYGFAWAGHFFIEKNKPATFKYPFWSLMGDFKMYFDWITGSLNEKLDK